MTFRVNPDCLYQSRRLPLPNGNRCPCNIYHPHSERKLMPISSNRRKVLALGLLVGLFSVNRLGAQNKTAEVAPARIKRLQPFLQTPTLIGQGKYSYWGFDVYNASLWAGEATISSDQWASQRIALELHYLRDFNGADIAKRSIDEMHAQSALPKNKAAVWLKTLEGIFPNVGKGQYLTGIFIPNVGAQFFYDNTAIGEIKDPELAKRFFDIWLAPQTSAPDLRKRLFAGN